MIFILRIDYRWNGGDPLARRVFQDTSTTREQQRPAVLDCALHDRTHDKAGVECYPVSPAIRKEVLATKHQANAAQV